jgi:hypothetical protein
MKLFTVELSIEVVCAARDESAAEDAARKALRDGDLDHPEFSAIAQPMRHLPQNWDMESVPFDDGTPDDKYRPLGAWFELGAAPEFKEAP